MWSIAAFVLWTGPRRAANRRLAVILFLHGVAISNWVLVPIFDDRAMGQAAGMLNLLALLVIPILYLWFLSTLPSRWAQPLRTKLGKGLLAAGVVAMPLPFYLAGSTFRGQLTPWFAGGWSVNLQSATLWLYQSTVLVILLGLAITIEAYVRAPRGSAQRGKAGWFLLAFGLHDVYYGYRVAVLAFVQAGDPLGGSWITPTVLYGRPISLIVWAALLAYGILRYQVVDIDVRLKRGTGRAIVLAAVAATFFVASELAEAVLPIDGLVPGIVAAALLALGFLPLQRATGRLLDRLVPPATSSQRDQRREDIYADAVEAALLDKGLTADERAVLNRLRLRLGLDSRQATVVERSTQV